MNSSRSSHEIYGLPHVLIDGFKHRMPMVEYHERCYFLTHYHSDHYGGLTSHWKHGTIYCTNTTANLICNVLGVDAKIVRRVNIGESTVIKGASVTFMDANHCPGAAILLFQLTDGSGLTHLHTGDLRFCPAMKLYPALQGVKVDRLYLDTTYAHPKHTFMAQDESIAKIVTLAKEFIAENPVEGIIYMSAYNLGKERVIFALNDALNLPVYMDADKILIVSQIEGGLERVQNGQFTSNPQGAKIHICSMGFLGTLFPFFKPNFENIRQHMEDMNKLLPVPGERARKHFRHTKHAKMPLILPCVTATATGDDDTDVTGTGTSENVEEHIKPTKVSRVMAFIPTGWADTGNFNKQHSSMTEGGITVCIVPYSEHSNYPELMEFVSFLKPREVIPTVYSDEKNRLFILDLFRNCVDRISNLRNFIATIAAPAPVCVTTGSPGGRVLSNREVVVGSYSSSSGGSSSSSSRGGGSSNRGGLCAVRSEVKSTFSSSSSSSPVVQVVATGRDSTITSYKHTECTSYQEPVDLCSDSEEVSGVVNGPHSSRKREVDVNRPEINVKTSETGLKRMNSACEEKELSWTCSVCTYRHVGSGRELYLQCILCSSPRLPVG